MSIQITRPPARTKRFRAGALILGALVLGGTAVGGMNTFAAAPAQAIDAYHGAGINWGVGVHANGAGNFILPDGRFVYCAEMFVFTDPGSSIPNYVDADTIPGKSDGGIEVYATSGDALKKIGFVISKYGQTNDSAQAAATAYAVWAMRSGNAGYNAQLAIVANSIGAGVVDLANSYINEANTWVSAGGGSGFDYTWDPSVISSTAPYEGTLSVPPGATQMTIENGSWADGSTTKTWNGGAPAGTQLSWVGIPPSSEKWDKYYRVSFSGKRLVPGGVQFGDGGGWQASITAGAPVERPLSTIYLDPDTTWAPSVSSLVTSEFIKKGETFSDTITFGSLTAAIGRSDQWRWRLAEDGVTKEWMPIKAKGTVYGPYISDPALNPQPTVPVGAPVAATFEYSVLNEDGSFVTEDPTGKQIPIDTGIKSKEQGYYTFVWEIIGDDQHESVTGVDDCVTPDREAGCRVFPTNYYFSDGFGTKGETQAVKMKPEFNTELSTHELTLGDTYTDAITVPERQNWLRDDQGKRHTQTLTGTAYLVNTPELVQSAEIPADAVAVGTTKVVTDPEENGQVLVSEDLMLDIYTPLEAKHLTMVWCVVDADQEPQSQGIWEEKCDDFGIPAESAKIVHPDVTTKAVEAVWTGEDAHDTAIVTGHVPSAESGVKTEVTFEVYEAAKGTPVCTDENRLFNLDTPVEVTKPGEYPSEKVQFTTVGDKHWVETLKYVYPDETEKVIKRGICGLPDETTKVKERPVLALTGAMGHPTGLAYGLGIAGLLAAAGTSAFVIARKRHAAAFAASNSRDCEG